MPSAAARPAKATCLTWQKTRRTSLVRPLSEVPMKKKFYLMTYHYYFESWRLLSAILLAVALALWIWSPAPLQPFQALLMLAAGLGALVLVFGFAMYRLAFVAVGDKGLVVQLPFWRVRFPFDAVKLARTTSLNSLTSGKWDADLGELSALQVDV